MTGGNRNSLGLYADKLKELVRMHQLHIVEIIYGWQLVFISNSAITVDH
jgi:hypothetical protein